MLRLLPILSLLAACGASDASDPVDDTDRTEDSGSDEPAPADTGDAPDSGAPSDSGVPADSGEPGDSAAAPVGVLDMDTPALASGASATGASVTWVNPVVCDGGWSLVHPMSSAAFPVPFEAPADGSQALQLNPFTDQQFVDGFSFEAAYPCGLRVEVPMAVTAGATYRVEVVARVADAGVVGEVAALSLSAFGAVFHTASLSQPDAWVTVGGTATASASANALDLGVEARVGDDQGGTANATVWISDVLVYENP